MHPILIDFGSFKLYTYGFCIAVGAMLGGLYLWRQGKIQYGITFDQANTLFVLLIFAGVIGGKIFLLIPDPAPYLGQPLRLFSGNGFVFYGSLITAIPVMLWYFKKNQLPVAGMLDIMAGAICIVHGFGRVGCFFAGCCYGLPTDNFLGVVFTDVACQANPLDVPLHPTQLYEATLIFSILIFLLIQKKSKRFDGQQFLLYLILYAIGRSVLETLRGDVSRGFIIGDWLSTSQFISLLVILVAVYFYIKLNRKATLTKN